MRAGKKIMISIVSSVGFLGVSNVFSQLIDDSNTEIPPPPAPFSRVICDRTYTKCNTLGDSQDDDNSHSDECDHMVCSFPIAYYTIDKGQTWHRSFVERRTKGADTYHHLVDWTCSADGLKCTAVGQGNGGYRYNSTPLTNLSDDGGQHWFLSLLQPPLINRDTEICTWQDHLDSINCDSSYTKCTTTGWAVDTFDGEQREVPIKYISTDAGNTWKLYSI